MKVKPKPTHGGARPGAGRKHDGRIGVHIKILPAALKAIDSRKTGPADSRGRVIERMVEDADSPRRKAILKLLREK